MLALRCLDCKQLLSLGEAREPEIDIWVAETLNFRCALDEEQAPYLHDGGSLSITTGDQADAWAWDISRPLAEQLAEAAAADAWNCPAQSNECAIRRKCIRADRCQPDGRGAGAWGPLEVVMRDQIMATMADTRSGAKMMFGPREPRKPEPTEAEGVQAFGVDGELG